MSERPLSKYRKLRQENEEAIKRIYDGEDIFLEDASYKDDDNREDILDLHNLYHNARRNLEKAQSLLAKLYNLGV